MKRFFWELRQVANALGVTGLAGLVTLALSIFLYSASVVPAKRDIENIRHSLSELGSHTVAAYRQRPDEDLAMFYAFFPKREVLHAQLRTIHRLATEKNISISNVEYKLSKLQGTPLVRYQISFSVNSDYISLRHYIAAVLQTLPNAAVEEIELQREDVETRTLDEKIGLVLFFQSAP